MDINTLFLRQIHPNFIQGEHVTSQAFRPNDNDEDQLSVYNGTKFNPENSFKHYTEKIEKQSAGVLGITSDECTNEGLISSENNIPFDGHCIIDFSSLTSQGQKEKKAKKLRNISFAKGWLYKI